MRRLNSILRHTVRYAPLVPKKTRRPLAIFMFWPAMFAVVLVLASKFAVAIEVVFAIGIVSTIGYRLYNRWRDWL